MARFSKFKCSSSTKKLKQILSFVLFFSGRKPKIFKKPTAKKRLVQSLPFSVTIKKSISLPVPAFAQDRLLQIPIILMPDIHFKNPATFNAFLNLFSAKLYLSFLNAIIPSLFLKK